MATDQTTASSDPVHVDPPAVRLDEHGRLRVGRTRVLLDMVVHAYKDGKTAEGIVDSYGSLSLADAYGAIAYYLRHTAEVEEYLRRMDVEAQALHQKLEREGYSDPDLGRRLRERQAAQEAQP